MTVADNIKFIEKEIAKIVSDYKLESKPNLIAVSKNHSQEKILEAIAYGHKLFGENRVLEATEKWSDIKNKYIELHLIGALQTNKVENAVKIFDVIQSLDREKLALKLQEQEQKQNKKLKYFIQVNTGEEEQKSGVSLQEIEAFTSFCRDSCKLDIVGLMCIPPKDEEPSPHFALLKKLAKRLNLNNVSMGMSGDYKIATIMGATHIRVGTSIFGNRSYNTRGEVK